MLGNKNDVAGVIRSLRKSRGIKQYVFAEMIGVSKLHMSQVECGKKQPSRQMLENIAIKTDTTLVIVFVEKPKL